MKPEDFSHQQLMRLAIAQASQCKPNDPNTTPMVGAVIEKGGKILAMGSRQPDVHAEKHALDQVSDKTVLAGATVYTTLEPCTPGVRSKPHESCTKLLVDAHLSKVVIGILDPNQQVCGKGLLELQKHGIEVELFPHDLAVEIRLLNDRFIRTQQTLGVQFIDPKPDSNIETNQRHGRYTFRCKCLNEPGPNVFVLIERNGLWWPQAKGLSHLQDDEYSFEIAFGEFGTHTIHVVRANELGMALYKYYLRVVDRNQKLRKRIEQENHLKDALGIFSEVGEYPGIPMLKLPTGVDSQGSMRFDVVAAPE